MIRKTLGIFGGSFDPIHLGHLHSLWELQWFVPLNKIHFIPCAQSPLKKSPLASNKQRLEMLQLAIAPQKNWVVDDREIKRQGVSYTIDTLKSLRQDFPEDNLCLILGTDTIIDLPKWHQWENLLAYAHIIVITRPTFVLPDLPWVHDFKKHDLTNSQELQTKRCGGVWWQAITPLHISATQIREYCQQQQVPLYLLPSAVAHYIQKNNLYSE